MICALAESGEYSLKVGVDESGAASAAVAGARTAAAARAGSIARTRARYRRMGAILHLVSRGHFTQDRAAKKNPAGGGVVGRLLVWRSVFSLLYGALGARLVALVPDPAFLVRRPWLACFPNMRLCR